MHSHGTAGNLRPVENGQGGSDKLWRGRGGEQIAYTYDSMNRIKTATANGLTVEYKYDKNGNVQTTKTGEILATYAYDARNFLTSLTNQISAKTEVNTYEYNDLGLQTKKTENGEVTEYEYNALGRLVRIVENDGRTTEYEYDIKN